MSSGEATWTVERAQRELDPDLRWEIDRGELIVREPASWWPGAVSMYIGRVLSEFIEAHDLGMVLGADAGFWLQRGPDTLRAPDVAFVGWERFRRIGDPGAFAQVVPDMVVEVLSPSDRRGYLERKVAQYLALGVRSVWVVDPRRRTLRRYLAGGGVLLFAEGGDEVEDPVLPGFRCGLALLFPATAPRTGAGE